MSRSWEEVSRLPHPAAHSMLQKPPREDVHACPPLAERIGGGVGRNTTKSNRERRDRITARAERATSFPALEKSSNLVVQCNQFEIGSDSEEPIQT